MGFQCIQLSKSFPIRNGAVIALDNLNFTIKEQEFVCIVGPSGCGKTTLLKIIAGLIQPTTGEILFDDGTIAGQQLSAMVFQDQGLFPWMTILDNVSFGLEMQGVAKEIRNTRAMELLDKVGLGSFRNEYPPHLSGGMRQRVAILRAFLADPQILLMDEPLGGLDSQSRLVIQDELLRIWKEHRKTVLYVTHDIEEAILLSDRVLVMSGRPAHIQKEYLVPLSRPRRLTDLDIPVILEMKWQIWKLLEDEVRKELAMVI